MGERIRELLVGLHTPPEWRFLPANSGRADETLADSCYGDLLAGLHAAFPDVPAERIVATEPGVPGLPDASGSRYGIAATIAYFSPEALAEHVARDGATVQQVARRAQVGAARRAVRTILGLFARHPDCVRLETSLEARRNIGPMTWVEAAELAEHVARYRPCGIDPQTIALDTSEDGQGFVVTAPVYFTDVEIAIPVTWITPAEVQVGEALAVSSTGVADAVVLAV